MPLQDPFQPPLSLRRDWHSFYNSWATYLAAEMNQKLPPGYLAEANVQFGIEIDVATFDESPPVNGKGIASDGTVTTDPTGELCETCRARPLVRNVYRKSRRGSKACG